MSDQPDDVYFTRPVNYYRDVADVPEVPRDLYHHTFLVLWRSRRTSKQLEFKIVTYNSTGWVYCNREKLNGFVHGWVILEAMPVL
jgi:hypothetical protein